MKDNKNWDKFIGDKIPSSLEIQPVIYKFIKKDYKIIDVGCGFGKTVFNLYKKGYVNISGTDSNRSGIEFAKSKSKQLELNPRPIFNTENALCLPYQNFSFDCVITQAFWTTIIDRKESLQIIKGINRILKKNGILYIADFEQNYHLPIYRKRYQDGTNKGYEKGTFEVTNKKTNKLEYLAHHHTKKELYKLTEKGGFSEVEYYKSIIFTTRSGNKINGCVMIVRKT